MRIFLSLVLLTCATGCATAPATASRDPFEGFNRSVFQFNEKLDQAVVRPVAETYQQITPQPVRTGVKNFFGNLSDVWSTVNNALQLKPVPAVESFMRVLVNSTVGLYGVLDIPYESPIAGAIDAVLDGHIGNIEAMRSKFTKPEECCLLNIIDEISALYAKTLYKLQVLS